MKDSRVRKEKCSRKMQAQSNITNYIKVPLFFLRMFKSLYYFGKMYHQTTSKGMYLDINE